MSKARSKKTDPTAEPKTLTPAPAPPVPATPHAWSAKQWQASPAIQAELQALLDSRVMRMAFQTLLIMVMPKAQPAKELVPGVSAEAMMLNDNNRYHHRSGMTAMYRLIHGLARPANSQEPNNTQWGALQFEDEKA